MAINSPYYETTYMIDLPFRLSNRGGVSVIPDSDSKVWKNKVLSLFSVDQDARVWYHTYGSNLYSILFENTPTAVGEARRIIEEVFIAWAPELKLRHVAADIDSGSGIIYLTIIYQTPTGETDSVKITTETLTSSGDTLKVG